MPVGSPPATPPRRATHPAFTHAPLGGLLIAAALDAISAAGVGGPDLYRAGTYALMVGTTVMFVAIGSGLVDRARGTAAGTRARGRADVHGAIMGVVLVGSVVDLTLRRGLYPSAQHTPAAVLAGTLATLVLAVVGGELGGRLTYRAGVNVAARPAGASRS